MLQDLIQADSDRVELKLTSESVVLYENYIDLQQEKIIDQAKLYIDTKQLLAEARGERDSLERELLVTNREVTRVKKSRRGWIAAAIASITLFIIK